MTIISSDQNVALLLDRDGVINVDSGYVHKKENFSFMPGIFDLVRFANKKNYIVCVVTNQAGIGRGFYTRSEFLALTAWMKEQFESNDCIIHKVYYSPFHPTHGLGYYKREHRSRKPNPGMILDAIRDWNLSASGSVLVGDNESDIEAADRAEIGTKILLRGYQASCAPTKATAVVESLGAVRAFLH